MILDDLFSVQLSCLPAFSVLCRTRCINQLDDSSVLASHRIRRLISLSLISCLRSSVSILSAEETALFALMRGRGIAFVLKVLISLYCFSCSKLTVPESTCNIFKLPKIFVDIGRNSYRNNPSLILYCYGRFWISPSDNLIRCH